MPDQRHENDKPRTQISSTVGGPEWNAKHETAQGPATEADEELLDRIGPEETPTNYRQTP